MYAENIDKAQEALYIDHQEKPKKVEKIGTLSGHKVAVLIILGVASGLAAIAAVIAILYASYIIMAVCAAAFATLVLSAIIASRMNVSQALIGLIDNLRKKIIELFDSKQAMQKENQEKKIPKIQPQIEALPVVKDKPVDKVSEHEKKARELNPTSNEILNKDEVIQPKDTFPKVKPVEQIKPLKRSVQEHKAEFESANLQQKINEAQDREKLLQRQLKQKDQELERHTKAKQDHSKLQKEFDELKIKHDKSVEEKYKWDANEKNYLAQIEDLKKKLTDKENTIKGMIALHKQFELYPGITKAYADVKEIIEKAIDDFKFDIPKKTDKKFFEDLKAKAKDTVLARINKNLDDLKVKGLIAPAEGAATN